MKLIALAAFLLLPNAALAQVYKCTGKDGRVTWSQTKPRDAACAETAPASTAPTGAGGSNMESLMKMSGEIDKQRAAQNKVQREAAEQQAVREARCSRSRSRLAFLQQASRVFVMREDGTRDYQSDEQKAASEAEAQSAVSRDCG